MTEERVGEERPEPDPDPARLASCRACGNRVARSARRCPACGAHDPLGDKGETAPRHRQPRDGQWSRSRVLPLVIPLAALTLGALVMFVFIRVTRPPTPEATAPVPSSSAVPVERVEPNPAPALAVLPPPPPTEPSRSRGRPDWPFFFKPGDRLARMGDAKPLGYIMSTVKAHRFPDGTVGPAYMLWTPAGDEQAFDADELERSAKME